MSRAIAIALYGSNEYFYSVGDLLTTVCVYSVCPMCECVHIFCTLLIPFPASGGWRLF